MKRSPLKRGKPLRRVSAKKRRRDRQAKPFRDAYKAAHPKCEVFCCSAKATELHEITRGPNRHTSLDIEACVLHLCHDCHLKMGLFKPVEQLALKKLAGSGYCRVTVNLIRNPKTPEAITEDEVDQEVKKLRDAPLASGS